MSKRRCIFLTFPGDFEAGVFGLNGKSQGCIFAAGTIGAKSSCDPATLRKFHYLPKIPWLDDCLTGDGVVFEKVFLGDGLIFPEFFYFWFTDFGVSG